MRGVAASAPTHGHRGWSYPLISRRSVITLCLGVLLLPCLGGCSGVLLALAEDPSRVLDRVGTVRTDVEAALGPPVSETSDTADLTVCVYHYEYKRGGPGKGLLVAGLSASTFFVFEPILTAGVLMNETLPGKATVAYRADGGIVWWEASRIEGRRSRTQQGDTELGPSESGPWPPT